MVHEIAVHFKVDVIAAEKVIPRVFHPVSDNVAHIVKRIGIVDVPLIELKSGAVAHDVAPDERVIDVWVTWEWK